MNEKEMNKIMTLQYREFKGSLTEKDVNEK
jgi:hypothetical protein